MDRLTMAQETMWSDLKQRSLDLMFDGQFPENGSFVRRHIKGRDYFYYVGYETSSRGERESKRYSKYVGPADDPQIAETVLNFGRAKSGYRERRDLVRALQAVGLPRAPAFAGDVLESLWGAGLFRLRAVLVGTMAFQTYSGSMGVRFPVAATATGDIDVAQFRSISLAVEDVSDPILPALQKVDPSFATVPHMTSRSRVVTFVNGKGFKVEFLAPHRGSPEHGREPVKLPALNGVSGQPLRFMDFLIYQAERGILLHKAGIPVTVPRVERFCIHKLIVSQRRIAPSQEKSRKDLMQAAILLEAAEMTNMLADMGHIWKEAWERGPQWRRALMTAEKSLDEATRKRLVSARSAASIESGDPESTLETEMLAFARRPAPRVTNRAAKKRDDGGRG